MKKRRILSLLLVLSLLSSVLLVPMEDACAQVVYNWVKVDTQKDMKTDVSTDDLSVKNSYSGTTSQDIFTQTFRKKNSENEWYGGTSTCKCSLAPLTVQAGKTMKLTASAGITGLFGTRPSFLGEISAMAYVNSYGVKRLSKVSQGGKVYVSTQSDLTGTQSRSANGTILVDMPSLKEANVGDKFYVYFLGEGSSAEAGQITWVYQLKKQGTSSNSKKPAKVQITGITAVKKGINLKWKKITKNITGYQIQASTKKSFKTVNISSKQPKSVTSVKLRKIPSKTRVYVRVRAFNKVSGKVKYGAWSAVKTVVVK